MLCREFVITRGSVSGSIRNAVQSELGEPGGKHALLVHCASVCGPNRIIGVETVSLDSRRSASRIPRELNGRYVKTICPGVPLHGNRDLFWAPCLWSVGESCLDGSFGHHALGAILP